MTWVTNAAVQVQNLVTGTQVIGTNLTNNGWTLYDNVANAAVYSSTNNQGVTQYVQLTQVGSYQYIQMQAFQSWNAGTHAGTNGSGTSVHRIYLAGVAQAATVTVDLYMSVTANRFIIAIQGIGNYRHVGGFGGLGSLAGTNDPLCAYIWSTYETNANNYPGSGNLLQTLNAGAFWGQAGWATIAAHGNGGSNAAGAAKLNCQLIPSNGNQILIFPILVCDPSVNANASVFRGDMDGLFSCPVGPGAFGHLDTVTISGITYLLWIPWGISGSDGIPLQTSSTIATPMMAYAIAEA